MHTWSESLLSSFLREACESAKDGKSQCKLLTMDEQLAEMYVAGFNECVFTAMIRIAHCDKKVPEDTINCEV
eukprot:1354234-Amorphochlora_amoeboformis.AAC.1